MPLAAHRFSPSAIEGPKADVAKRRLGASLPPGGRSDVGLRPLVVFAVLIALAACGPKTAPATRPAPPSDAVVTVAPVNLAAELDRIFDAPAFGRMQWTALVQSVDSGEVLYEREAARLMMPASNMKVVTLAAAAERLGWDFRYRTSLVSEAPVENGVLRGDLIVVGTGDPTINGRGGSPTRVFESWADQLIAAGIRQIDGRIVADGRAFDTKNLGAGWAWDYLGYGYAAPIGALQFNEDVASIAIRPGPAAGARALVEVRPPESGLVLVNEVATVAGGSPDVELRRLPGSDRVTVAGSIPTGSQEITRSAAVNDPALYFVRALRSTLVAKGIRVVGDAVRLDAATQAQPTAPPRVLVEDQSPPLSEIARVLMKVSQNLYAETLVKTLGVAGGGTTRAGQEVVREILTGWGIPPEAYVLVDGSGLSRYNYLCAETLVRILRQMHRDPKHRDPFLATLPVGGQDGGTIARRFKGTRAEGNVKAKTGSIANVRALSGYVTTLDGETLVFSILANSFTQPQETIDAATDLAVERMANLRRTGKTGL